MHPHPYQNLHWYPLTSRKNIWPKISVAYFTKWFQPIFTVGGWRRYRLSISVCWPLPTKPHRVGKGVIFKPEPGRARNHKPKPGSSPTFIFEARVRPESQIYQGSYDMRNCRVTKNVVCRCSCRYTLYRTQNNNHLDQNIGIIWHKRSILVNDNTAECGI